MKFMYNIAYHYSKLSFMLDAGLSVVNFFPCLWPQIIPFNVKGSLRRLAPIFKVLPLPVWCFITLPVEHARKSHRNFGSSALFSGLHNWIMLVLEWFEWTLHPAQVRWHKIVLRRENWWRHKRYKGRRLTRAVEGWSEANGYNNKHSMTGLSANSFIVRCHMTSSK